MNVFREDSFFMHRWGGIYKTSSTPPQKKIVFYEHIFPFGSSLYERPLSEWVLKRFVPMTDDHVRSFIAATDAYRYQREVSVCKTTETPSAYFLSLKETYLAKSKKD